jgi:hypothetical protein
MFRTYFLLPLLIPLPFLRGGFAEVLFGALERWMEWLSAKPARAIVIVGAASFFACIGLAMASGVPVPQVADEFGYLLEGDTFAHGRVTNPTPALWQHFETIHEIMQPTYTAKYPPGQGLALALGEVLGAPIIGVWLSTALACAAMCWMLQAWMPARWALVGGLMAALHPQVLEWSQTYWGGAVAMAGGALVLGAFRRILNEPRIPDAVWLGVGLGLLANTRPYEGLVFAVLLTGAFIFLWIKEGRIPFSMIFARVFLPLAVVLMIFGAELCYYNWRVTGSPLVMPYVVHERTYALAPQFIFGKPWPEPQYRHRDIRDLHENYLQYFKSQVSSVGALVRAEGDKAGTMAQAYLWSYLLVVALLGLPWALKRDGLLRILLLIGVLFSAAQLLETWAFSHYAAPVTGLFFVLVVESMRRLWDWQIGNRRPGRNLLRGLAILFVISYFQLMEKMATADKTRWFYQRQALVDKLRGEPGKSLVFVKYDPDHNPHREWIYNEAKLDDAKVVLAQDMGPRNQELLDYYRGRKGWVVHADAAKPELEPYPGN